MKKTFTKYPSNYVKASSESSSMIIDKYLDSGLWVKANVAGTPCWLKIRDINDTDTGILANKLILSDSKAEWQKSVNVEYDIPTTDILFIQPIETAEDDNLLDVTDLPAELIEEIFAYLDECFYVADYDQAVEDVAEDYSLTKSQANSIVWDWTIQIHDDDEDKEP